MKRIFAGILAVLALLSLAACGTEAQSGGNVSVDIAQVKQKIITDLQIADPLDLPTERLADLYYIETADVKDSACFITMGGAFPDEIVLVEAVDENAAKRIAEKLEARLADVTNQAQNYDADSLALLKACKVETAGNYVHLFISAKSAQMREIFNAAKK